MRQYNDTGMILMKFECDMNVWSELVDLRLIILWKLGKQADLQAVEWNCSIFVQKGL